MAVDRFVKPALLIVDMQNDFVRVGAPMEVPQARDTISQHQQLIQHFRKNSLPIVYTRFLAGSEPRLLWEFSQKLAPPILACHAGHKRFYSDIHKTLECIEVIDELAPKPEDLVIDKLGYGAFHGTKLDDVLRQRGIESLVVTRHCDSDLCRRNRARSLSLWIQDHPRFRCSLFLPSRSSRCHAEKFQPEIRLGFAYERSVAGTDPASELGMQCLRIALPCVEVETRLKWVWVVSTEDRRSPLGRRLPLSNVIFGGV